MDARRRVQNNALVDWSGVPTLNGRQQIALDKGMAIQKKDRLCTMEDLSKELFAAANPISRPPQKPAAPPRPVAPAPRSAAPAPRSVVQSYPQNSNYTIPLDNPIQNNPIDPAPVSEAIVEKKKNGNKIAIMFATIILALIVAFFTIHDWSEPTCEAPAICRVCKKEQGEPLGHDWTEPSCTQGKVCKVCGEVKDAAPGHDWIPATYEAPKKCRSCGVTEGNVKGYLGDVKVTVSTEKFWRTSRYTYVRELEKTLESCRFFTLNCQITSVDYGNVYGNHDVYIRLTDGEWRCIGTVQVTSQALHSFDFPLDPSVSFDALTMVCQTNGDWSYSYNMTITDVQLFVD